MVGHDRENRGYDWEMVDMTVESSSESAAKMSEKLSTNLRLIVCFGWYRSHVERSLGCRVLLTLLKNGLKRCAVGPKKLYPRSKLDAQASHKNCQHTVGKISSATIFSLPSPGLITTRTELSSIGFRSHFGSSGSSDQA
jgi:hypothetical protein